MARYDHDYDDDGFQPSRKKSSSSAGWIIGIIVGGVVCLLVCVGILIALLLPAVQQARHAARKSASNNNLKNIGFGLFHYESEHGTFPPGGIYDVKSDTDHHSWMTMILPQIDESHVYGKINFDEPWDSVNNQSIFRYEVPLYINPAVEQRLVNGNAAAHYSANNQLFGRNSLAKLWRISDGESNTFIAGEVNSNFLAWGNPRNYRDPASGINKGVNSFGSPFVGGANMIFADGHVKFISDDIAPATLKALSTPNGGEVVGSY